MSLHTITCPSCDLMSINGHACHETGCPNATATWDEDRQDWVRYVDCFECGYPVEIGTACSCQEEPLDEDF